ncbi:MAG: phage tail tape measure protein [Desulfobacteraceae bacterium]|nr:phage tail tape measure protein [Desulfobacteraceae bacterium]
MASKRFSAVVTIGGAVSSTLGRAFRSTSSEMRRVSTEIKVIKNRQKELSSSISEYTRLGRDVSGLKSEYQKLGAQLTRLRTVQGQLNKIQTQTEINLRNRSKYRSQLIDMVALGATISFPVKKAIAFEKSMARVGAVARASQAQLKALKETARALGAATTFSASQVANGMQFLAIAGFNTKKIIDSMPGMLNLAAAARTKLGRTTDIASNIIAGFKLKAKDMGKVGDILVNTFTSSNTTLEMLGLSMSYIAPVAQSLNVSIEQTAAMVGKLGDAGIQGSKAGTALRAMLSRLAAPSKEAGKIIDQLKVKTKNADGNIRSIPDILADLNLSMSKFGSAAKAEIVSTIFGIEAASAATILLGQAGAGNIKTYAKSLLEAGSAARVAKEQNDNVSGQWVKLGSVAESVGITIGNVLLPATIDIFKVLTKLGSALESCAAKYPQVTKVVVIGTASMVALKVAAIATGYAFTFVKGGILLAAGALIRMKAATLLTCGGLGMAQTAFISVASRAIPLVITGFKLLTTVIAANPIGALVAGIALGATLIIANWSKIKPYLNSVWKKIDPVFSKIKKIMTSVFSLVPLGLIVKKWQPVKSFFKNIATFISSKFNFNPFEKLSSAWKKLITVFQFGKKKIEPIINWAGTKLEKIGGTLRSVGRIFGVKENKAVNSVDSSKNESKNTKNSAAEQVKNNQLLNKKNNNVFNFVVNAAPGQSAKEIAETAFRMLEEKIGQAQRSALFDGAY